MMHRRELLQVGSSGVLGLPLSAVFSDSSRAAVKQSQVKSVVLVFLTGGGSHLDTFDPKPEQVDIRGEFAPIDTRIPGVQFTEHLPLLADRSNQLAIVRSMAHRDNRHLSGTHHTLTGSIQPFRGNSNEDKELDRRDWPSYGSALARFQPKFDMPSQVTLPNPLIEGPLTWPGQHAGFLGPKYDPFQLNDDLNQENFEISGLQLQEGLSISRLENQHQLLRELNGQQRRLDQLARDRQFTSQQESAVSMLTSATMTQAFQLQQESSKDRERYGRNKLGQTLLLARRLVEHEVPVVQCNMGIVQTWDTHTDNFPKLKDRLLPQLDQSASALLDDLRDRNLLDQTLVIIVGEFGRTPRISSLPSTPGKPGRDHWAWAYSAVFAGGGVQGGQVIGKTDRIGAYPVTTPYSPSDLGATIYDLLGVDTTAEVHDRFGRPLRLNEGEVMRVLFNASTS